jgi:predicted O-methyltransferase YrrM
MSTPFSTRVRLKIKKVARELTETRSEREFRRHWHLLDSIEGWLLAPEAKWLFETVRSLPNRANIVEIGSYKGRSTCCLALACRKSEKRVFAIDSFDGGPNLPKVNSLPEFTKNMQRFGLSAYVEPIVGLSTDVAKSWDKPISLLFVDGSHIYQDVLADFACFGPHVLRGGIIAFHDVTNESWPDVGRAWREVIARQLNDTGNCESLSYGRKR